MRFRKLKASEIECRVSTVKANGLSLLLYKDARCDMRILDEIVGMEYWQRDHKDIKGNVYCGVSILCTTGEAIYETIDDTRLLIEREQKEWITKWDAGAESYTEKVKGEASDSFKRACFNWGIGRELYTSPFIWIKSVDKEIIKKGERHTTYAKFNVSEIEYTTDAISYVQIVDVTGKVRFTWGSPTLASDEQYNQINAYNLSEEKIAQWTKYFKVDFLQEITKTQAEFMLEKLGK